MIKTSLYPYTSLIPLSLLILKRNVKLLLWVPQASDLNTINILMKIIQRRVHRVSTINIKIAYCKAAMESANSTWLQAKNVKNQLKHSRLHIRTITFPTKTKSKQTELLLARNQPHITQKSWKNSQMVIPSNSTFAIQ